MTEEIVETSLIKVQNGPCLHRFELANEIRFPQSFDSDQKRPLHGHAANQTLSRVKHHEESKVYGSRNNPRQAEAGTKRDQVVGDPRPETSLWLDSKCGCLNHFLLRI